MNHGASVTSSSSLQSRRCFLQILHAARGTNKARPTTPATTSDTTAASNLKTLGVDPTSTHNPLPCFPLHPEHVRIISPPRSCSRFNSNTGSNSSTNESSSTPFQQQQPRVSSTPTEFHSHLCTSIRNAKRRIKLATLYIGAGNGCMSIPSSQTNHDPLNPICEEQLLQVIRDKSNNGDDIHDGCGGGGVGGVGGENNDLEMKIIMDASRALRPIRIQQKTKKHISDDSNNEIDPGAAKTTSSANEVYCALFPNRKQAKDTTTEKGISLFQVHQGFEAMLPSPLNEVMGVFHLKVCIFILLIQTILLFYYSHNSFPFCTLKVYIIDDELILSGANLSEEYFTDRLDRYMSFVHGANGLVDFYSDLIDILYDHSIPYDPKNENGRRKRTTTATKENQKSLNDALVKHFDGSDMFFHFNDENEMILDKDVVAYAIPTFQPSKRFLQQHQQQFRIPQDVHVIRDTILAVKDCFPTNSALFISSAYLNPTTLLMSAIEKFTSVGGGNSAYLLSAAPTSHGFKPKKKDDAVNGSGRGWIPSIFMKLAHEVDLKLSSSGSGKVLLYEREGYTFHAKGLWLTSSFSSYSENAESSNASKCQKGRKNITDPGNNLLVSVIGSSNYGSRSEVLDFESNCILVMNPMANNCAKSKQVKAAIAGDWNCMLDRHVEYGSRDDLGLEKSSYVNSFVKGIVTQVVRRFF